jgi:hypothetical protein
VDDSEAIRYVDWGLRLGRLNKRHIRRVVRANSIAKPELRISYFFFVKTLRSLGAVRVLWRDRFFQDAIIVARSIFEACVQISYIHTDPARLTERYLAYEAVEQRDLSVGIIRSSRAKSGVVLNRWRNEAQKHGRAAKASVHDFDEARGWSGKSLREMVRLLERKGFHGIWLDYQFFYPLFCALAHTTPTSMREYMARPYRTSYRQIPSRRRYFWDIPLFASSWCLLVGGLCANDHCLIAPDDELARVLIEISQFLETLKFHIEK